MPINYFPSPVHRNTCKHNVGWTVMIFLITYVTKPVLSKFVRCDWFFLCQYFAAELLLFFGAKPAYSKFTTKQPIKVNMVIFSFSSKTTKKS